MLKKILEKIFIENCFVDGDQFVSYYELNNPSDMGIEIYFKNIKVNNIIYWLDDSDIIELYTELLFSIKRYEDEIYIDSIYLRDGEIFVEY